MTLKPVFSAKSSCLQPFASLYFLILFPIDAASVVKRVLNSTQELNSELICVLPYLQKDVEYYENYDRVIIHESREKSQPKAAITNRNRWMVEQADLLICYVERGAKEDRASRG